MANDVTDPRRISTDALRTEEGITAVATMMGVAFRDDVLYPVLDHTPPDMHQSLAERVLSALSGVLCAYIGPENTKAALDAAKLAIDEVQKERRHAN